MMNSNSEVKVELSIYMYCIIYIVHHTINI